MERDRGGVGRIDTFSSDGIFFSAFFRASGSMAPSGTLPASREGVAPRENVRVERDAEELR